MTVVLDRPDWLSATSAAHRPRWELEAPIAPAPGSATRTPPDSTSSAPGHWCRWPAAVTSSTPTWTTAPPPPLSASSGTPLMPCWSATPACIAAPGGTRRCAPPCTKGPAGRYASSSAAGPTTRSSSPSTRRTRSTCWRTRCRRTPRSWCSRPSTTPHFCPWERDGVNVVRLPAPASPQRPSTRSITRCGPGLRGRLCWSSPAHRMSPARSGRSPPSRRSPVPVAPGSRWTRLSWLRTVRSRSPSWASTTSHCPATSSTRRTGRAR